MAGILTMMGALSRYLLNQLGQGKEIVVWYGIKKNGLTFDFKTFPKRIPNCTTF